MLTRRQALCCGAATAAIISLQQTSEVHAQVGKRRDLSKLATNDKILESYRKAVTAMMDLPTTDGRSWYRQAKIHWDNCAHANWFFLPWHREYIRRFEEIVRELSGDPEFYLPFWDWNSNRQVPAGFWGSGNPLDPANLQLEKFASADNDVKRLLQRIGKKRAIDPNGVVGNDTDFSLEHLRAVLGISSSFSDFASARASSLNQRPGGSELENTLHGTVHDDVGGQMQQFYSPLDPIFWVHHANVDRLWTLWKAQNPSVSIPDDWGKFPIPKGMFFDARGNASPEIDCAHLENTHQVGIGYEYEDVPSQSVSVAIGLLQTQLFATKVAADKQLLGEKAVTPATFTAEGQSKTQGRQWAALEVSVPQLPPPAALIGAGALGEAAASSRVTGEITLNNLPEVQDARYRIFVNCDYLNPNTMRSDPHYVTTISLFSTLRGGHGDHGNANFHVNLGPAIAKLAGNQRPLADKVLVQVQPEPLPGVKEIGTSITLSAAKVTVS